MVQRRFHYDNAFEYYLRAKAIPYVGVDEARKALYGPKKLKSFDFVVYASTGPNLLVDVKGRKHTGKSRSQLDNWVTEDDVKDLEQWQRVFGQGFTAAFVFLYWCAAQPPDALFHEIFEYRERWYAVLGVPLDEYRRHMKPRSAKWKTVSVPAAIFGRIAQPLSELLGGAVNSSPSPSV
jgi:hypothetical protein